MNAYVSGATFERKVRTDLTSHGYEVMRAAGSKGSTKADLVAIKPGQILLVQCKRDGQCIRAEWDRLVEVAGWVDAVPILASSGPKGRGVLYTHLLGPKRRYSRVQPVATFALGEKAVA